MRIPFIRPADLSPEQRSLYDDMKTGIEEHFKGFKAISDDGELMGPWNPMIHTPSIGGPVWDLIKSMVSDLKSIETAVNVFQDSYRGFPGDLSNAPNLIPGCVTGVYCSSGDGNLKVASDGTDQYTWRSPVVGTNPQAGESIQFWKHLALLDLFGGIDISANPATPRFGASHLASRIGSGGFEFYYDALTTIFPQGTHILRLSSESVLSGSAALGVLTPLQAEKIDNIMDDGEPNSGSVVANYGTLADTCKDGTAAGAPSSYKVTTTSADCIMFFRLLK